MVEDGLSVLGFYYCTVNMDFMWYTPEYHKLMSIQ